MGVKRVNCRVRDVVHFKSANEHLIFAWVKKMLFNYIESIGATCYSRCSKALVTTTTIPIITIIIVIIFVVVIVVIAIIIMTN